MNKSSCFIAVMVVGVCLMLTGIQNVEAKRFGGGSSFGSRPSHSTPFQGSASTTRSASQQQMTNQNQMARQNISQRGGLMGMLGGLAIGGLLGSLFFGGAFENINFMDIALFIMAFFLIKTLLSKAKNTAQPAYQRTSDFNTPSDKSSNSAGFNTDLLFKKSESSASTINLNKNTLPTGFETNAFLAGAKNAYITLQKAWDARDLAEIRGLTTDKVFAEIQTQLKASTSDDQTDIISFEAELIDVREIGSELVASVWFEAFMREELNGPTIKNKEVWHFVKSKSSLQPKWLLDGIQQWVD